MQNYISLHKNVIKNQTVGYFSQYNCKHYLIVIKSTEDMRMNSKISSEIEKYSTEDFKNLYRQIKYMNILNQLYDSDGIQQDQFTAEETEIMGRFKRLKSHLAQYDLHSFAKLYNIQNQFKRLSNQSEKQRSGTDKQLMNLCLTLGSKFPQLSDTIHASKETRQVKDVINLLSQMTHLLSKYRKMVKNPSPDLLVSIDKLENIFQISKKKNINEQFTAMEYYQLEDAISKLWLEFSTFN